MMHRDAMSAAVATANAVSKSQEKLSKLFLQLNGVCLSNVQGVLRNMTVDE